MTDIFSIISHWTSCLSRQVRLLLFPVIYLRTDSRTSTLVSFTTSIYISSVCTTQYTTTADDHTRVELKGDPDVEGSDYINASFIDVNQL